MASYPMLDFTPWAGQWAMRHHDFLVLGICAGWCGFRWQQADRRGAEHSRSRSPLVYVYLAWVTISAAVLGYAVAVSRHGDAGAIVHLSPGNAFRSAKGCLARLCDRCLLSEDQRAEAIRCWSPCHEGPRLH